MPFAREPVDDINGLVSIMKMPMASYLASSTTGMLEPRNGKRIRRQDVSIKDW